jgi:hypothetical protein
VCCLCVNVYCTTATGWQLNCSKQICHISYNCLSDFHLTVICNFFGTEGNRERGGGGAHIPGTLKDEWRALGSGHLSARESRMGGP